MLSLEPSVGIPWERASLGTNCARDCWNNWSVQTLEFQFLLALYNILVHLQPDSQRVQFDITKWPLATPTSLYLFLSLCHSVYYTILWDGTAVCVPFWSSLKKKMCWAVFQLNQFPDLLHHLAACTNWANTHRRAGQHTAGTEVCGKTQANKCRKPVLLSNILQSQATPRVSESRKSLHSV